jgi:membrane-associated HD superfamily phosphohydrolase
VERYEKRAPKKNGKVPPQQLWMELIVSCIDTAPVHLQSYIRTMSTLGNVPRKEKPFYNFTTNSLNLKGNHGNGIVAEIWNHLSESRRNKTQSEKVSINVPDVESTNDDVTLNTQSAATTCTTTNTDDTVLLPSLPTAVTKPEHDVVVKIDKKAVKKVMKNAFKSAKSNEITIKILRKLVKAQFKKEEHTMVKDILKQTIDQGKTFARKGKAVILLKKD